MPHLPHAGIRVRCARGLLNRGNGIVLVKCQGPRSLIPAILCKNFMLTYTKDAADVADDSAQIPLNSPRAIISATILWLIALRFENYCEKGAPGQAKTTQTCIPLCKPTAKICRRLPTLQNIRHIVP